MLDKKQILDKISSSEDRFLLSNIFDKALQSQKCRCIECSNFLNPGQQKIAINMLNQLKINHYILTGGYEGAERKVIIFKPEDNSTDFNTGSHNNVPLVSIIIQLPTNTSLGSLTHRDFLGSIMGLGIERSKIGDIILSDSSCYVIVIETIADYILYNLDKVGSHKVKCSQINNSQIKLIEQNTKLINTTVSSLRLDSIVATGFGLSRSDAVKYIQAGKVTLNWKEQLKADALVQEHSTISIRGKGRLILSECGHVSKKGRIHIKLEKPI